jgi:hypothetical protein
MSEKPDEPRARQAIRRHPWASLLAAGALGFLIARLTRRQP